MKNEEIIQALNWRYATKEFDINKKVSDEDLHTILESGRMAPSSIGTEPWKFIVVNNPRLRQEIRTASYNQSKVTDSSHLIVIARRIDAQMLPLELIERTSKAQHKTTEELAGLKSMAEGAIAGRPDIKDLDAWITAQTYIPLGMMIETSSLLGVDTCPMEGFDSLKINEILGLPEKNLKAVTMLTIGYRAPNDIYAELPKARRVFEEVVEIIE